MVEGVIFNWLAQRVDAAKNVEGLEKGRTFFIVTLIPAAFQPFEIISFSDVDVA